MLKNTTDTTQTSEIVQPESFDEIFARRIEQDRIETSKQFGVPLWILTRPVEPHMQESPEELD